MTTDEKLDILTESVVKLTDAVERLNYILKGNGKIGLTSKVEILWRSNIWVAVLAIGIVVKLWFFK